MPRVLQSGYPPSSKQKTVTSVAKGGTNASSAYQAVINLGGINKDLINSPNGIARLNGVGVISTDNLPSLITTGATVNGPVSLTVNQVQAYTITNFNNFKLYTITAITGSVSVSGATITYTAPATGGAGGFIVNGRNINITIIPIKPAAPTITYPTFNASNIAVNAALTANAFAMITGSDTHISSDWQIASDNAFTNIVAQTLNDTTNKTSWTISPSIANNVTYYLRVRYKGTTYGYGDWSSTIIFTTGTANNVTTEEAVLVPLSGDASNSGLFGASVTIDGVGNRVAISQIGALGVFVFLRTGSNWALETKIIPSDVIVSDKVGYSISFGNTGVRLAIGCPQNDTSGTNTGCVYIYRKDIAGWVLETKLQASVPSPGDYFGYSVNLSSGGDKLVVGAPYKDNGGTDKGSVYVFTRTGSVWTQQAMLTSSDGGSNDYFGNSVAISGDGTRIIVGSLLNDSSGLTDAGAAYVFKFTSSWVQEIKLVPSDGAIGDNFGFSVAINNDGTRAAIGSYYAQPGSLYRAGAVYVFFKDGSDVWSQEAKLVASDKAINDQFGYSVSISDDGSQISIGANNKVYSSTARGKIYIFSRSGTAWSQTTGFQGDSSPDVRGLGSSICIARDKSRVISGAIGSYINSVFSGSASIFR